MPLDGLALVGFMKENHAINYLQKLCVVSDAWKQGALRSHWKKAREQLGSPTPNAGHPHSEEIEGHDDYLNAIRAMPRFQATYGKKSYSFKMVDIAEILAFQFGVITENPAAKACAALSDDATVDELLPLCLPQVLDEVNPTITAVADGFVIESDDVNLRVLAGSQGDNPDLKVFGRGMVFGSGDPWILVVKLQDRYYLANGYHRVSGLLKAGVKRMPCILRETADSSEIGIRGDGKTFDLGRLNASDPPTCAHFAEGRAYSVKFRKMKRMLQLTWKDDLLPLE